MKPQKKEKIEINLLDQLGFKEGDKVWFRNEKGAKFIFKIISMYLKPNKQPMVVLRCGKAWGGEEYAMPALLFEKVPQEVLDKIEEAKARKLAEKTEKELEENQKPQRISFDQIKSEDKKSKNDAKDANRPPRKFKFERR